MSWNRPKKGQPIFDQQSLDHQYVVRFSIKTSVSPEITKVWKSDFPFFFFYIWYDFFSI